MAGNKTANLVSHHHPHKLCKASWCSWVSTWRKKLLIKVNITFPSKKVVIERTIDLLLKYKKSRKNCFFILNTVIGNPSRWPGMVKSPLWLASLDVYYILIFQEIRRNEMMTQNKNFETIIVYLTCRTLYACLEFIF